MNSIKVKLRLLFLFAFRQLNVICYKNKLCLTEKNKINYSNPLEILNNLLKGKSNRDNKQSFLIFF